MCKNKENDGKIGGRKEMIWQDIIFAIGSFVFVLALLPSIFGKNKPDMKTSLMTFLVLCAFVGCYITLGFWVSVVSGSLTAICWLILFAQKVKQCV